MKIGKNQTAKYNSHQNSHQRKWLLEIKKPFSL